MGKQLNLPILDLLENSQSILVAGAGGGFDIYAGLPIYFTLKELGKTVHLANYSFCDFGIVEATGETEILIPNLLMAAKGNVKIPVDYLPEHYLAQWFTEKRRESIPIWMFENTGTKRLAQAYEKLVEHLKIDAIILVDGGVDSIMRGDEEGAGSLLEDTISLLAVEHLNVPVKVLASIGFGTEVEERVCHHHALQNMAALIKKGGFHGSCSLTPDMPAFQLYEEAARYTWEQPGHRTSHISTRIIPAARGEFGNFHMYEKDGKRLSSYPNFLSPLMSIYWFFDVLTVLKQSYIAPALAETVSKDDAWTQTKRHIMGIEVVRRRRDIPY